MRAFTEKVPRPVRSHTMPCHPLLATTDPVFPSRIVFWISRSPILSLSFPAISRIFDTIMAAEQNTATTYMVSNQKLDVDIFPNFLGILIFYWKTRDIGSSRLFFPYLSVWQAGHQQWWPFPSGDSFPYLLCAFVCGLVHLWETWYVESLRYVPEWSHSHMPYLLFHSSGEFRVRIHVKELNDCTQTKKVVGTFKNSWLFGALGVHYYH